MHEVVAAEVWSEGLDELAETGPEAFLRSACYGFAGTGARLDASATGRRLMDPLLTAFSRRLLNLRVVAVAGEAFLLLPALSFLVFVSVTSQAQFLRYALPVLPFVCVWLGHGWTRTLRRRHFLNAVQVVCVLLAAISSLAVVPHALSFFNRPAGGPEHGHRWMIDSSHDWGQDLLYLKAWCDRHPERRPLRLAYFGKVDPRCVEIGYELPQLVPSDGIETGNADFQPPPGWYAVSASLLQGHHWIAVPDGTGGRISDSHLSFTWLQKYQPVDRAGKSILIYHIERSGSSLARGSEGVEHRTGGQTGLQGGALHGW